MKTQLFIGDKATRTVTTNRFRPSEMKRMLLTLSAACVAAVVLLSGYDRLGASENQTEQDLRNGTDIGGVILAQNATPTEAEHVTVNVDQHGVILKGYDPVAYFVQGTAVKGSPDNNSTYGGAIYYFASYENKVKFDQNPAKYAVQYGGFCADSMARRKLSDIDPNEFITYEGKLYVCTSARAKAAFLNATDTNVKKADANWKFYAAPSKPGFRREFGS